MRRLLPLWLTWALAVSTLQAQEPPPIPEVASTWPGIDLQVIKVERIPGNRLLIAVGVHATPKAPAISTLIGIEVQPPANATIQLIDSGVFRPRPYSIVSATMTDEQALQTYATVKPDPAGPSYLPPLLLTNLYPNQTRYMTIQFPAPPPPQPQAGITPKQTISILLPQAVGPIAKIPVPPPTPTTPTAAP